MGVSLMCFGWKGAILEVTLFFPSWFDKVSDWTMWVVIEYGFPLDSSHEIVLVLVRKHLDITMFLLGLQILCLSATIHSQKLEKNLWIILTCLVVVLGGFEWFYSWGNFFRESFFISFLGYTCYFLSYLCLLVQIFLALWSKCSWYVYCFRFLLLCLIWLNVCFVTYYSTPIWDLSYEGNLIKLSYLEIPGTPEGLAWLNTQIIASYGFPFCMDDPCISPCKKKWSKASEIDKEAKMHGGTRYQKLSMGGSKFVMNEGMDQICQSMAKNLRDCLNSWKKK